MSTGKHKFLVHRRAIIERKYSVLLPHTLDSVRPLISTLILLSLHTSIPASNSTTAPWMMLIVCLVSFLFAAWGKFGRRSTNSCLVFLCTISMLRRSKIGWSCYCSYNCLITGDVVLSFMPKVALPLDMFLAAFYIGIVKVFGLGTGTLHFSLVILLVVHDPGALRSDCKELWIVATKIRGNLTSHGIDFNESRSTRHRIEIRRILVGFFASPQLAFTTLYDIDQVGFSLFLLLLSCVNFFCFYSQRLERHFIFSWSSWPFFEKNILHILVALARPAVHPLL